MRMNPKGGVNAKDWLRKVSEEELAEVLRRLGEEPRAKKISRAIIRARDKSPITTTSRLANIVIDISPGGAHRIHPATRTFQAIRMHINKELESLHKGLNACTNLLGKGGRLCVISFHSLEDRKVKTVFKTDTRLQRITTKPLKPTDKEIVINPRSKSAKLRIASRKVQI